MSATREEPIKETVKVLISALNDKENAVNNVVIKSLCKIANNYPNEVIEIFCDFYKNTAKINSVQLGNIIKVLEQTCVNQIKKLKSDVVGELIKAMLRAMTQSNDNETSVQMGASSVLVAAGHMYLDMVLRTLINEITPSSVPHYTIAHTLGRLAASATYDTVPHIKVILSKMLPLLPLVKAHAVKQAFSYAFGQFAVAVSEQIGDNVENDNITGIKENFVVEFSIIFDVLYNQWLHSSEPKVTEAVLEALGPITRLISERKFDEIINKFILILLSMYRKSVINSYCISQCISYLLSPSPLNPKITLNDNVITAANHTLFTLVLIEPDYDQPHTIKNHFEVLRCFDHMAEQFPDATIESVMHQCKNNQEKERMKAVIVLTHLTTSSQYFIDKYSSKFIAILKVMIVMEQSLKMKKLIVKAIVGLVYRNCISNTDDFGMVEFIVKNCGYEGGPNVLKEDVSELQDTCRSSLVLMCNTVTSVRAQLRSLLLNALTLEEFTSSMSTITNCLINLLQNNSEILPETQKENDKNEVVEKPKVSAELIFIRCMIHLVDPGKIDRNKNLLIFLEEFSGDIHRNLKNSWTVEIRRLLKYFEKNESIEQWHAMLLDLLVSAIGEVNNNKWTENVTGALSDQILKTKQSPLVKGISLQYLAIISCHLTNAAIVENVLKILLFSLKSIPMESCEFVSQAIGIASRQHGEHVLNELDVIYKDLDAKKSSKILNFISARHSKNDAEINIVKYAVITCYGKVAEQSLDVHVLARLGEHVTNLLHEILKSHPTMDICRATISTLHQISKALLPASHHNVVIRNRWLLLNAVLDQLFNPNLEKRNVELLPIIVKASKGLTKLQKGILPEERNTILRVVFDYIFNELANTGKKNNESGDVASEIVTNALNDSLILLHELVKELVIQSTCLSTIDDLVSLLIEWLNHEVDEIRIATVQILQVIFYAYIKNVRLNYETPSKFGQMGYLLGVIIPGLGDTNYQVRLSTIDCVKLIIQTQDLYEGRTIEPDDECMKMLSSYNNNIQSDLTMVAEFCNALCECIYEKIPHNYTMQFIESLLQSFNEEEYRCIAIGAVLETLLIKRGSDLYQNVDRILEVILDTMDGVSEVCGRKLLPAVKSLCRYHGNAVTAVLLSQRLPFKLSVIAIWRHLACDNELSLMIVEDFLNLMNTIELFEDPYHITENHIASLQSLTIISALADMLQEISTSNFCRKKFPELFALLFTTLVVYMDAVAPAYSLPHNKYKEKFGYIPNREAARLSPAKIALQAFNMFLVRADCVKIKEAYSHLLQLDGDSSITLLDLVPVISSALCRECPQHVSRVVTSLSPYAKSILPPHRCAVIAFFGELLACRCNDNECLLTSVMATLNFGCKDNHERVRATSLRAVANIVHLKRDQLTQYLPMALGPLSQGVDAQKVSLPLDNVPLAAIQGLSRLLTDIPDIDKENHRELMSISQKIRPFMNTDCAQLREASIRLFGILASTIKSDNLVEHGLWSLPCFLLHLCDSTPAVVRASKYTLKQVFKIFNVKKSYEMVQTHLLDEGKLYIEQFIPALLKALAEEMPTCVPTLIHQSGYYLVSNREDLRPYAPLLIGTLYAEMNRIRSSDLDITVELDNGVTQTNRATLTHLLSDSVAIVRQHSAVALADVCLYQLL